MSPEDIHRAIGRLEGKVDILLERTSASEVERKDHDKRIAQLETDAATSKAVVGIIGTIAGSASALLAKFFGDT